MRNWELASAQRVTETQPSESTSLVEDFISVSRQVGAEGRRVAKALGERLGWPVFDREILDVMAGDDTVRRQIYASMDGRDLSCNDYFRKLSETLLSLARQSHCILVGRGADLVLPPEVGFRARLVAPPAMRESHLADIHCLTANEARQYLKRVEAERRRFFRNHFGVDMNDLISPLIVRWPCISTIRLPCHFTTSRCGRRRKYSRSSSLSRMYAPASV